MPAYFGETFDHGDILVPQLKTLAIEDSAKKVTKFGYTDIEMGDISHPNFGKAQVKFSVPNMLKIGEFEFHSKEAKARAVQVIVDWMVKNGFEYDLGSAEERDTLLNASVDVVECLFSPKIYSIDSPVLISMVSLMAMGFYVDDLYESTFVKGSTGNCGEMEEKIRGIANDVLLGKYSNLSDLPKLDFPMLQPVLWLNYFTYEQGSIGCSNFDTFIRMLIKKQNNGIQAGLILAAQEFIDSCSDETYMNFRQYDIGVSLAHSLIGMATNAIATEKLTSNLLYKRYQGIANRITAITNDLFGIEKDMRQGCKMNIILRRVHRDKMNLQKSIDQAINEVQVLLNDSLLLADKLVEENQDDPTVKLYIDHFKYYCDGHFRIYEVSTRWCDLKLTYRDN